MVSLDSAVDCTQCEAVLPRSCRAARLPRRAPYRCGCVTVGVVHIQTGGVLLSPLFSPPPALVVGGCVWTCRWEM